jgi:hypothetical protein
LFPTPSSSASCWLPLSSAANRLFGVEKSRDTASPRPERTAANNQKVWASQVRYNFLVSARTQQDDMHHRSILTTRMKKQEEEEEGALLRVSTSPSSTELPRINHN